VSQTVSGCESVRAKITVIVNPIPTVSVNSPTLCSGASVVLTATPAPTGTYTYAWTTPTGVTNPGSVASFNATVAGTYSVTIKNTVTNCTSGSQSAVVTVVNTPSIQLQNESICLGESITLVPIPSVQGGTYVWSPGGETTSSITVSPSKSSQYSVTYSVGQCTSKPASSTVSIDANPIAEFSANPNVFTKDSETIQFVNNSKGSVTYKWDFGDGSTSDKSNPSHFFQSIEEEGYPVTLYAISSAGCIDSFSVLIEKKEMLIYYVPNTFTPDGNSVNGVFKPIFTSGFDPYNFRMLIYNRWGELIFETRDAEVGWEGTYGTGENAKICQDGTYVWKIDFKLLESDKYISINGHVNLVR
jgi:gliding motility-associated-like protein